MVCIGPFLAIPRTAATTYEMTVQPITSGVNITVFSIIYFIISWALTIRPSSVVDILGKFLTPALFICLAVLIIAGIIWPLGDITEPVCDNIVQEGVLNGYQAMDVLAALGFAIIIIELQETKGILSLHRPERLL